MKLIKSNKKKINAIFMAVGFNKDDEFDYYKEVKATLDRNGGWAVMGGELDDGVNSFTFEVRLWTTEEDDQPEMHLTEVKRQSHRMGDGHMCWEIEGK